jgi:ribosomal protein L32
MANCFLCGYKLAEYSGPFQNDSSYHAKCPNCGEYHLPVEIHCLLEAGYYKEGQRIIASGRVFDESYYNHAPKLLARNDFEAVMKIDCLEKTYRLAKYFFTEATRSGNNGLYQRPACCFCLFTDENYDELMKFLGDKGIISFVYALDDDEDITSRFLEIRVTIKAMTVFEKGIDTAEQFEEIFMATEKSGITYNFYAPAQLNQATGDGTITATQNNGPDMAGLQILIDRLLQAVPKDTPPEQVEQIKESIETIQAEMKNHPPRKNMIKTILAGLGGLVRAAEFAVALTNLASFFGV